MPNEPARWGLLETDQFVEDRNACGHDIERFDQLMDAILWKIVRHADDPAECPEVMPGTGIRLARAALPGYYSPILRVWFTLDLVKRNADLQGVDIGYPPHVDYDWTAPFTE